jgi:hypothetical protein
MKHMKSIFAVMLALAFVLAASTAFAETSRLGENLIKFNPTRLVAKTAAYTATTSDSQINVDATSAGVTITLPSVSDCMSGMRCSYKIIKTDSSVNTVTTSPASGDTVGGESARVIVNQNGYIVINAGPGRDWTVRFESPYVVEDHEAGTSDIGTVSYDASIVFEGATSNAYETTLSVVDPTADATWSIPAATAGTFYVMATALSTNYVDAANAVTGVSNGLQFEGATADAFETTLTVADATADSTATIPNATGTLAMTAGVGSYSVYSAPTVSTTFTTADCGKVIGVGTDALTHVLPATAAGCTFTFVNTGAAGNNIITIDPNAADNIWGTFTLAASVVVSEGAAGVTIVNTKATSVKGDAVTLVGDGADGWFIIHSTGIWAEGS